MAKGNAFESKLLEHIFQNTAIAGIGDAAGVLASATAGSVFFSLHSADPGDGGAQNTSELAYTGYARVAVARSTAAFAVTTANGSVSPAANVEFPTSTGTGATAHFFGVGSTSTGAGMLFYSGTAAPAVSIVPGTAPRLTTATTITED